VPDLRQLRSIPWLVPAVVVVAVVVAVLVLGRGDDGRAPGSDGAGPGSPTSTSTPSAPPTRVDPDTWCVAFIAFANAQAQYVGAPEDEAMRAGLQQAADDLLALGDPIGLSEGGLTSLQILVDGSLDQAGEPTTPPGDAAPDQKALDAYLQAACPA
jgi:hypothetical protein